MKTHTEKLQAVTEASNNNVFRKIAAKAANITMLAANAGCEDDEKKRDKAMNLIIKLNEEIEHLYSTNWH